VQVWIVALLIRPDIRIRTRLELPSYCCFPGQVEAHAGMIARAEQEAARLAEERQSVSLRAAQLAAQVSHTHPPAFPRVL
jgi:hypothetical protein